MDGAKQQRIRISIHAAQEGCDITASANFLKIKIISIHAAQEGCDRRKQAYCLAAALFQSTQPKRAATAEQRKNNPERVKISIHAAQEGCDQREKVKSITADISIHAAQEGCDRQIYC